MDKLQVIEKILLLNIQSGHIMLQVKDRDLLLNTIERQQEEIIALKNKNRVKTCIALEADNLEFAQKLHSANREIERLRVVEAAYEAYKKAW